MTLCHISLPHLITSLGLISDIAGAAVLAWGLFLGEDEAVKLSGQSGVAYYADRGAGAPREQMLQQPAVKDRLQQSRNAKIGFALLILGFIGQLAGTWWPSS